MVAFSWDETVGVRLYIDGELAAKLDKEAILYAGLDQFGTHSRVISNAQVQSSYNYMRTGDFDEITVFDRMLTDEEVRAVSRLETPALAKLPGAGIWAGSAGNGNGRGASASTPGKCPRR